jgi:hypothetical protein
MSSGRGSYCPKRARISSARQAIASDVTYAFAFTCFALALIWAALQSHSPGYLLFWPAISCGVLAFAYGAKQPHLVCGKKSNGKASWFWDTVNLPWLLFSWATWLLLAGISREHVINQISGSNIFISRWPLFGADLRRFDVVVDLAAELPRFYHFDGRYESVPNLDGLELINLRMMPELGQSTKILVHCAQGHGRSAAFVALLLGRLGFAGSAHAAIAEILAARPLAKMSHRQRRQVELNFQAEASMAFSGSGLSLVSSRQLSLSADSLDEFLRKHRFVAIHAWAHWNQYDNQMRKVLESLASEPMWLAVAFARIDVTLPQNHAFCRRLNVINLPFLPFYRDAVIIQSAIGMKAPDAIAAYLRELVHGTD